jgi:hypothetical protein
MNAYPLDEIPEIDDLPSPADLYRSDDLPIVQSETSPNLPEYPNPADPPKIDRLLADFRKYSIGHVRRLFR